MSGPRSRGRARRAGRADARVVWPPQERQSARSLIDALLRERGMPRGFERNVQRAAKRARDRGLDAHDDVSERRDLTDLPTFTIDPLSARDFDDAISAQALADDRTRVWVHIADVCAHVSEGSPVDAEARRRGTSVYAPGAVVPMLPQELSNDACSLLPASERLTVTVELELRGAEVLNAAFYRSLIRSDERLDYERVDRIFAGREQAAEHWAASLAAARAAAAALQAARERRGALVIDSEEPEFIFDDEGNIAEIRARLQTEAHRLIEHLMIAANEAVAALLARQKVPCLYRVHERPEQEGIERLLAALATLEVPTPALPETISASQAAALVGEISRRVDQHVRRTGRGRLALSSLVLRSLKQAYYSPRNLGHAGLHSQAYCHFTSPIRRYPDLVCHRALLSAVGGGERAPRAGELSELGAWTSEREREAMMIERDADDVAACFDLERRLYEDGWEQVFPGEVTGLISAGAFVAFGAPLHDAPPPGGAAGAREGDAPRARGHDSADGGGGDASGSAGEPAARPVYEGMLPVRRMQLASGERDWWEVNEQGTILRAERGGTTLRLGEEIAVRVSRVDTPRGRVDLLPAVEEAPGG